MKLPANLGMILLAAWLILFGVLTAPFLRFSFAYSGDLLALLAIVAGVLLLDAASLTSFRSSTNLQARVRRPNSRKLPARLGLSEIEPYDTGSC